MGITPEPRYILPMMMREAPAPSPDWCLFLDVDGTLIDFSDTPSPTRPDGALNDLLDDVDRSLGGRLALVSGRTIENLDRLFTPRRFAAAGLHGLERRSATGQLHRPDDTPDGIALARPALRAFADRHPGVHLEDKGQTLALHYRGAPRAEHAVRALLARVAAQLGGEFHVQEGSQVMELKPLRHTKATAVEAFLGEEPFAGCTPVFVGDDLTDRDGFRVVERNGGISIAVGDRVRAQCRLEDTSAVRVWLRRVAAMDRSPA